MEELQDDENSNNSSDDEKEFDDDDFVVEDDYSNFNHGIDDSGNLKIKENDEQVEDDLFDLSDDHIDLMTLISNNKKITKTGIEIMSKFEYAKLYGKLAEYIRNSSIEIPDGLLNDPEVLSGDEFRISRLWIKRRNEFNIPVLISREIYRGRNEEIRSETLLAPDDLAFRDDHDDSYKFDYNFRNEPYETGF